MLRQAINDARKRCPYSLAKNQQGTESERCVSLADHCSVLINRTSKIFPRLFDFKVDTECRETYNDVVYLVDGSGSVGSQNFANLKGFLQLLAKSHSIGPGEIV